MASIADYNREALDRSLNPALDFMASHPVYSSIGVKSGRRSKASNRKAGGAKKSQHLLGKALDLDVSRLSNAQKSQLLSDLASYGIKGVGIYDNNNIHIDARKDFATWGPNPKGKYAGVEISQQPKWARQALTAIQQAGPYKAFPAAPAAVPGTASLAIGPAGTSLAETYRTAQYQRAMPSGPTPPATAPVPSSRPLDSIGGLGATYRTATRGRVAPSSQAAPVGERFGYPASPASLPAPSRFGAVTMQDDIAMAPQPRSPPIGAVSGPLGPTSTAARMPDQSQRFRPSAAPAAVRPSIANFGNIREPEAQIPGGPKANEVISARPGSLMRDIRATVASPPHRGMTGTPAAQQATPDQLRQAHFVNAVSRSLAPATPVGQAPAPAPAPAPSRFGPPVSPQTRSMIAAPAPAPADMVKATTMQAMPNSPPLGAVNAPLGPANAPPAALAAAKNLGTAIAAKQAPAAIPPDVRQTAAYASMPPSTPAALAEKVSQPAPRQVAAAPQVAQQAQQRPAGGLPAGVAGPWGADIANQTPAIDRMTTQSTAQPQQKGFLGTIGQGIKAAAPVLGSLALGPLGGLLGASIASAKPGQLLGNPFQGLGNTAKAMGMFQSGTPYSGPISNYGTGLRAIGDVLGGAAPVGSRAYSRSTPGYHVTALPGGTIQRTNQYGFTSFERPSMGPTGSSFPGGFSGGFGGIFGGGWTAKRQVVRRPDISWQVEQ